VAPSNLTLDDLEGSKIKVILFDCYMPRTTRITMLDPWASLWMTLRCYRSRSQSFDAKYLENGDIRSWIPCREDFFGFRLAQSDLTLDDTEGPKIKVTLFDVKYVKNGKAAKVTMLDPTKI